MAQAPKPTGVCTSTLLVGHETSDRRQRYQREYRSLSETRATPSRAVFSELSDAHASINGRRTSNWPSLSPGWAKDQPVAPGNTKSRQSREFKSRRVRTPYCAK